jgi:hypothetical protein
MPSLLRAIAVLIMLATCAARAQSLSPEPYQATGGWARAIFRLDSTGYHQVGPLLFEPNDVDCPAEARKITAAMEQRQRPPGCTTMMCTPYFFVTCTRFGEGVKWTPIVRQSEPSSKV